MAITFQSSPTGNIEENHLAHILRRICSQKAKKRKTRFPRSVAETLEARTLLSGTGFEANFDFGDSGSPVATDYTQVLSTTTYSSGTGYGWESGSILSRDRGAAFGDDVSRDFNFTQLGTFAVDLPTAGTYDVTLVMGDGGGYLCDEMGIFLEGELVDSVTASGGNFAVNTYRVHVTDGQLNVMFQDLGGDPVVMINAMSVVLVDADQQDATGPRVVTGEPVGSNVNVEPLHGHLQ